MQSDSSNKSIFSMNLNNKTAIVTGGTSGIGEAIVEYFAGAGASVIIAGRNKERGEILENKIKTNKGSARFVSYDANDEESIKNVISQTLFLYNSIDILVNNAGIFPPPSDRGGGALETLEKEAWDEIFRVNMDSYFLFTKYAMPYLVKKRGVVLNNASVSGLQSYVKGQSYAYSASKSAVVQFSNVCALNYGKDVRINCICPGIIETPLFIDRNFDRFIDRIPAKRVGTPEDVAKAALFLCSDYASYINGAVITVDGGLSL